jgi:hypothetical protein
MEKLAVDQQSADQVCYITWWCEYEDFGQQLITYPEWYMIILLK